MADLTNAEDTRTAEHHTVGSTRYLCHRDDHYCPDDGLRAQIEAALRASWDTSGVNVHMDDAIRRDTDAVLPVIERHTEQLRRERAEAEETSLRFLTQRQEMATERYTWQERGDRAEDRLAAIREYVEHSDDDGIRTRETVLRLLDGGKA